MNELYNHLNLKTWIIILLQIVTDNKDQGRICDQMRDVSTVKGQVTWF